MLRRSFLKTTASASAPFLLGGISVRTLAQNRLFSAMNPDNDRVLVLVLLNGGNDGLSTLLPLDQYDVLGNARPNVLIPEGAGIGLTDTAALHPELGGFADLYDRAKLNIVQAVGYPNQNRSHFRSLDIWNSGSPADEFWATGWLGRHFTADHPDYPLGYPNDDQPHPFALTIGSTVSQTCQGLGTNFSLALVDPGSISQIVQGAEGSTPNTPYGEELTWLRQILEQTNAYGSVITDANDAGGNLASYPAERFAEQLRVVARLINGGLQTKVYIVSLDGFDTHADQVQTGEPLVGVHADLLRQLNDGVAAFQEDLKQMGLEDRVLGMTYSEFGRRIRSNFSDGTDHGSAAPMLLFGACVRPGFTGSNPDLPTDPGTQDGVAMQFDFRDVYGSVLMDWFEVPEDDVVSILHPDFTYLPLLEPCDQTVVSNRQPERFYVDLRAVLFPNPVRNHGTLSLELPNAERVTVQLFDPRGAWMRTWFDGTLSAGTHQIPVSFRGLAAGNYFYRVQTGAGTTAARTVVKL